MPSGTKNDNFGATSQVENIGLLGHENFFERCSMNDLKTFAHIYMLYINFTILKCHIALETAFLVVLHFSGVKAWNKKTVPLQ